jgi:hypothetical protein
LDTDAIAGGEDSPVMDEAQLYVLAQGEDTESSPMSD